MLTDTKNTSVCTLSACYFDLITFRILVNFARVFLAIPIGRLILVWSLPLFLWCTLSDMLLFFVFLNIQHRRKCLRSFPNLIYGDYDALCKIQYLICLTAKILYLLQEFCQFIRRWYRRIIYVKLHIFFFHRWLFHLWCFHSPAV